jgi:hypothetical protein
VGSDDLTSTVIPGWSEGPDPESRDSGFDASHRPGMTANILTPTRRGLIAAPMINAATMFSTRRRRILAVWAVVCV